MSVPSSEVKIVEERGRRGRDGGLRIAGKQRDPDGTGRGWMGVACPSVAPPLPTAERCETEGGVCFFFSLSDNPVMHTIAFFPPLWY